MTIPQHYQRHIDEIPAELRARMSLGEQVARAIEAETWAVKAAATGAGELYRWYVHQQHTVLTALPAHEVDAQAEMWRSRAAATGDTVLKSSYRAQASRVAENNPRPSAESLFKAAQFVPAADRRFGASAQSLVRNKTTATVTAVRADGLGHPVTEMGSGRPVGVVSDAGFLAKAAPAASPSDAARYARLAEQVTDRDLKTYYRAKVAEMRETP